MKKTVKLLASVSAFVVMMLAMTFTAMAVETITPSKAVVGTEKAVTKAYSFNQSNKLSTYNYGIVIPVTVSEAGGLELTLDVVKLDKNYTVEIYIDSALNNRVSGFYEYVEQGETQFKKYVSLSAKGTYYILVSSSIYDDNPSFTNSFKLSARLFPRSDRTIKSGQTITYYRENGTDIYYFKYKAAKTGKVTVTFSYEYGSYLTLTNSKKKALSDEEWVSTGTNNNKYVFAVKKGVTYYFKVSTNGTSGTTAAGNGNLHTINVKNTAVSAKGGSSKKKAATIKYNKTVKGLISAGDKTAKWYKITLKSGKKPAFILNGNVTGTLKVQILNKRGKVITTSNWSGVKSQYNSWGSWKKGTYYIKVTRANSLSSGYFTIKNKQAKK